MDYDYFQWDWFGINIVVPVLGPLLVLWLFSLPTKVAALTKHIVIKSIGKGELFSAVMGMAATTCYDLDALKAIETNATSVKIANWAHAARFCVIMFAVLMVGLNSLESIPSAPPPTPTANPHIPDKFIFGSSIIFLLAVIGTYTVVNAKLLEQEANIRKNAIMKIQECVAKHKANAEHCVEDMK